MRYFIGAKKWGPTSGERKAYHRGLVEGTYNERKRIIKLLEEYSTSAPEVEASDQFCYYSPAFMADLKRGLD
jgi:hypothetical protein